MQKIDFQFNSWAKCALIFDMYACKFALYSYFDKHVYGKSDTVLMADEKMKMLIHVCTDLSDCEVFRR
jgi:hypothetical protein